MKYNFDEHFKRYEQYDPSVPVWCLTPNEGCYTHRFFNTVPISPSGRYIAVLNMPYEDKPSRFGDGAKVVVIDLFNAQERTVATTYGWEHQLGANINWGASDNELIFNDVDINTHEAFAVCLNIETGQKRRLEHTIYHVSPNGRTGVGSNSVSMCRTQLGYGVTLPEDMVPIHDINTDDDGLWTVDISTGKAKLLLSIKEIFERTHSERERFLLQDFGVYCFHSTWSPDGKKIMFTTRHVPPEHKTGFHIIAVENALEYCVYTCNADGSGLEIAVDESQWSKGGHHTTWAPTSDALTMNLNIYNNGMRLCKAELVGRHVERLIEHVQGSGHPSFHPEKNIMVSDTYGFEDLAYGDGTVPIRIIDLDLYDEHPSPIRINIVHEHTDKSPVLRVDPHPVWGRCANYVIFNGHTDGCRRVFIADMTKFLDI